MSLKVNIRSEARVMKESDEMMSTVVSVKRENNSHRFLLFVV